MGRSHLTSGVVSGLAVCAVVDVPPVLIPVVVGVSAYSALAPDADHYSAPAANILGPVSWVLCWLIRYVSARTTGVKHRGISHSMLFAIAWAAVVGCTAAVWLPGQVASWMAAAALVGCLTHIAGDVLTVSGCQHVLWPSTRQVAMPSLLRFRTGGTGERRVVRVLIGVGVLLLPAVLS